MTTQPAIAFRVLGTPKGQPRPRAFARKFGDKWSARVYDSHTAEGWKSEIAIAARPHLPNIPLAGPLALQCIFFFQRPGRLNHKKDPAEAIRHTEKPDLDNAVKAVMDCMTALGFWADDTQVCEFAEGTGKWYVAKDQRPGAIIRIFSLDAPLS